jgi:hypothetical protein
MTLNDIAILRLANHQISSSKFREPAELVSWMGAMQAQDYPMSKWAVGIRLPGSTDLAIESAISSGKIIRTHLLRPTWHLTAAEDLGWIIDLTGPRIRSAMKFNDQSLGLTEAVFGKCNSLLEKVLNGGKHLTREELAIELRANDISLQGNRLSHILMRAETEKVICSGKMIGGKPSFALIHEWVPHTKTLHRDEALAELAKKYFTSHGPATLQDFVWWSGLLVSDAKQALEMVKPDFISVTIGNLTYWLGHSLPAPKPCSDFICFLPAYDEFTISYKERSASLTADIQRNAVSSNGVFRPIIVKNGQVTGTWKRTTKGDKINLETGLFDLKDHPSKDSLVKAAAAYGLFINKKIELIG